MSTSQAPEPTSYVVEGDSYRKLIAERDAYKRIANDLARQLRERTPADPSAPPERAAPETPVPHPPFGQCTAVVNDGSQLCSNAAEPGKHRCAQHSLNRGVTP